MGQETVATATLQCTFGAAPSVLSVLPTNRTMVGGPPGANIMDYIPMVNIMPFGVCTSLANPTVAAATSAAMGVLTPMPCIPVTVAPWGAGLADRADRQHAGAQQHVKMHVHLGRRHQHHLPGAGDHPGALTADPRAVSCRQNGMSSAWRRIGSRRASSAIGSPWSSARTSNGSQGESG